MLAQFDSTRGGGAGGGGDRARRATLLAAVRKEADANAALVEAMNGEPLLYGGVVQVHARVRWGRARGFRLETFESGCNRVCGV